VRKTGTLIGLSAFALLFLVVLSACNSATPSSSSSQTLTSVTSSVISSNVTSSSATAPTTSSNTFGVLASSGQTVYNKYCTSCHGEKGQGRSGPALIGGSAGLAKYQTPQALLDFIAKTMPLAGPGSLSHQEYLDVLCYLLVQNNYASAETVFDESRLSNIALK
jgi:cytochrome c5